MNYFTLDEDLHQIVAATLVGEAIRQIDQISTGWTNIVFDVQTDKDRHIFRFPRDDFWAKTIRKDAELARFIYGKTDFTTVHPELLTDSKGRPFTRHRWLEGKPLAEAINELSASQTKDIAKEIAKFLHQLHSIEFSLDEVFPNTDFGQNLVDFLNELLTVHIPADEFSFWNYEKMQNEEMSCLVHGDFNTSNILLDSDYHVAAILDFGFGGLGNSYSDLSRILSRPYPNGLKEELLQEYQLLSSKTLDSYKVDKARILWQEIDQAYIKYMTKIGIYQPEA